MTTNVPSSRPRPDKPQCEQRPDVPTDKSGRVVFEPEATGPSLSGPVARRLLCFELSQLLTARRVTHERAGELLGVSRASFSQAISGKNLLSKPAMQVLLTYLGATNALPRLLHLNKLARQSRATTSTSGPELVIGLEAYSSKIKLYDLARFGQLISEDRWRVLVRDNAPKLVWLIEEHLIRRPHPSGMRDLLLRVMAQTNVTVQIVPYGVDHQLALSGAFEIVHGPAGVVACEDNRHVHNYIVVPEAVESYQSTFSALRVAAYSPDRSRELLKSLA